MKHAQKAASGKSHEAELQRENEMLRNQIAALLGTPSRMESPARMLVAEIQQLKQYNAELNAKVKWFEEQILLQRKCMFGKSSEQSIPGQMLLEPIERVFDEAELSTFEDEIEPAAELDNAKKRKPAVAREALREDLPTEEVHHELPEEERVCGCCGGNLHDIGTETHSVIKYIPAKIIKVQHIRHNYACRACERDGTGAGVVSAPEPASILPKSMATASIVSAIAGKKFLQSQPLYRQQEEFERLGVNLSRQTMSNWLLNTTERWLQPVYKRMQTHLRKRDILMADETTLQVLQESSRNASSKSYMWLFRTGREGPAIVLYNYQTTRASKHPKAFLDGFSGYLQTDGYSGYHDLPRTVYVGCWAHARRGFVSALSILPKEERTKSPAYKAIQYCRKLYHIEHELDEKAANAAERFAAREEHSKPILEEFHAWLLEQKAVMLKKSLFGKAVEYCLNQWHGLVCYLKDGRLEIDNNRSERSIKPFVLGRKNWLFANTGRGANCSAILYSIIITAKENRLKAPEYLEWLLERLCATQKLDDVTLDGVMPWSDAVPAELRLTNK